MSALLAVLAATSGCAWRTGEAAGRAETAEPVDPAIWPARYRQRLDEIAAAMPATLDLKVIQFEQDEAGNWRQGWKPQPFFRVVEAEAHGHGVVVEVEWLDQRVDWSKSGKTMRFFRVQSWDEPFDGPPDGDFTLENFGGTALTLTVPDVRPVRGLIVSAGGGTKWDNAVRDRLVERGWANLHVGSPESMNGDRPDEFIYDDGESLDEVAKRVAAAVDASLADAAYAIEAGLSYLAANEPELVVGPVVLMGFSMGALQMPAAAGRVIDQVDALVLVCGGANLMDAALNTAWYEDRWLYIARRDAEGGEERPDREAREALSEAYLRHARLDPYHVAPSLRGIPTLMLHGMFDRVVPDGNGDLLWERLGRPARWSYPLGHGGTFWMMGFDRNRLVEWIEAAAGPERSE